MYRWMYRQTELQNPFQLILKHTKTKVEKLLEVKQALLFLTNHRLQLSPVKCKNVSANEVAEGVQGGT